MKLEKSLLAATLTASCFFVACGGDSSSGGNYFSCDVSKSANSVTMTMHVNGGVVRQTAEIRDDEVYMFFDETAPSTDLAKEKCYYRMDDEDTKDLKCNGKNISYYEVERMSGMTMDRLASQMEATCEEMQIANREEFDDDWDDDYGDDYKSNNSTKKSSGSTARSSSSTNKSSSSTKGTAYSGEFYCNVQQGETFVIVNENIPGYASYTEKTTLGDGRLDFVQEYVYENLRGFSSSSKSDLG